MAVVFFLIIIIDKNKIYKKYGYISLTSMGLFWRHIRSYHLHFAHELKRFGAPVHPSGNRLI